MPTDFAPTASPQNLRLRANLLRRLRAFFHERGFLEVETPLLSADTVVDRHLDPLGVIIPDDPRQPQQGRRYWLQTSPEFAMKRMLATGDYQAIFQITRAFRAGEAGPLHNLEFTIVEWYRAGDDMAAAMELLSQLAQLLLARGPARRTSYGAAFEEYAGIDPHEASSDALAAAAGRHALKPPPGLDRDGWLDFLLVELVEPQLGHESPVILFDYPATQAALAKIREAQPPVAERFELYVDGVELANGYHELLDADQLRQRTAIANRQRAADGKTQLPAENRLLDAMQHGLPPCSGAALGLDRLVMVAAGAKTLAEVMAFAIDRA